MRRNSRGGGASRARAQNWQAQRQNAPMASGARMPGQLGLQDIDKELELLKRKREIIEQQQQILSNEFRRTDYQEPQFSQSSRFDDYAQLYDDMRGYDPPSRKRPIAVWEDEIPTKRFSGPTRSRSRGYPRQGPPARSGPTNRGGYQGSQPRQPFRPQSGPFKSKPQPKKDFVPKAAKIAAATANKQSHPVAERKKLVTEAIELAQDSGLEQSRLHADREPSKQVTGRLELALGSIIKDIKSNPEHDEAVKSQSVMRHIKQTVRDRIREVMMDRIVGSGQSIKARYREIYDEQSDNEIVSKALEALPGETALAIIDDPEEYFKNNMNKIVQLKLKSMLKKLEESYHEEFSKAESDDTSEKKQDEPENKETSVFDANIIKTEKFKTLENFMTNKISQLFKKYIPYIIKIMDIDSKYVQLKNTITSDTVKMLMQKHGQEAEEMAVEIADASMRSLNTSRQPYKPMPYFAKLMGKPGLPKRNQMEIFFGEFQPKSIKKHRTVHNLLFVGFLEKESFEKFIAADGTKIGKHTLTIRVSERSNPEANPETKTDLNASVSSEDKLVGSELDGQITDLLSSIRKETDEGKEVEIEGETDSDVKNEGKDENTDAEAKNTNANDGKVENSVADDWKIDNTDTNGEKIENFDADEIAGTNEADEENVEAGNDTLEDLPAENADGNDEMLAKDADEILTGTEGINQDEKNGNAEGAEGSDKVPTLIPDKPGPAGKGTPARTSARIQTRRASKLTQNDA